MKHYDCFNCLASEASSYLQDALKLPKTTPDEKER